MNDLIIRGTTKCNCGREFVIRDINGLKRIDDDKFYGGVVKHYSETRCPQCGKEVILLLKQAGQTYEVINTAERPNQNVVKPVGNRIENVKIPVIVNDDIKIPTTIENKTETNKSNEFICPECGKVLKTKSGLTNHMKTHNK